MKVKFKSSIRGSDYTIGKIYDNAVKAGEYYLVPNDKGEVERCHESHFEIVEDDGVKVYETIEILQGIADGKITAGMSFKHVDDWSFAYYDLCICRGGTINDSCGEPFPVSQQFLNAHWSRIETWHKCTWKEAVDLLKHVPPTDKKIRCLDPKGNYAYVDRESLLTVKQLLEYQWEYRDQREM